VLLLQEVLRPVSVFFKKRKTDEYIFWAYIVREEYKLTTATVLVCTVNWQCKSAAGKRSRPTDPFLLREEKDFSFFLLFLLSVVDGRRDPFGQAA